MARSWYHVCVTLYDKTWQTHSSKSAVESTIRRAEACKRDDASEARRKARECVSCYYLRAGRLVGQAFTDWKCFACGREGMHPNTGVPRLCTECADENGACVECGADIELRPTTTVQGAMR